MKISVLRKELSECIDLEVNSLEDARSCSIVDKESGESVELTHKEIEKLYFEVKQILLRDSALR